MNSVILTLVPLLIKHDAMEYRMLRLYLNIIYHLKKIKLFYKVRLWRLLPGFIAYARNKNGIS